MLFPSDKLERGICFYFAAPMQVKQIPRLHPKGRKTGARRGPHLVAPATRAKGVW